MAKHKIARRFNEQVEWKFRKQLNANRLASSGRHSCIMVLDGLNPSHNIGKIFRSAEVFDIRSIHLINTPLFNVSPAKGAFKRIPAHFYDTFKQSYLALIEQGYDIYALAPAKKVPERSENQNTNSNETLVQQLPRTQDSSKHSLFLHQHQFTKKTAFVMGHEQNGLSFTLNDYPKIKALSIQQFGQTESLNVAVAASLCLYEYTNQINQKHPINE